MPKAVLWLACLALILSAPTHAQIVDATRIGTPIDLSSQTWRFAVGDDPHYADLAFDDSQWKTFSPQKTFRGQGYAVPSGMWWHRLHVHVPPGTKNLAMTMTDGS